VLAKASASSSHARQSRARLRQMWQPKIHAKRIHATILAAASVAIEMWQPWRRRRRRQRRRRPQRRQRPRRRPPWPRRQGSPSSDAHLRKREARSPLSARASAHVLATCHQCRSILEGHLPLRYRYPWTRTPCAPLRSCSQTPPARPNCRGSDDLLPSASSQPPARPVPVPAPSRDPAPTRIPLAVSMPVPAPVSVRAP